MGKREDLEAKLIENPHDTELRMVYADLLQSTGDPRGELIALQTKGSPDADAYFAKHADTFLGPLAKFTKTFDHDVRDAFTWKDGFIRSASIGYESYSDNKEAKNQYAHVVLDALLPHPSAMLLEELTVTMNMDDDGMYFDGTCKALAKHGAPALRSLRIGEFVHAGPGDVDNGYEYEISWSSLGDASGVWEKLPRLESLRIQAGLGGSSANNDMDLIGTFDLPRLRRLEVVTGGMGSDCARSFASGKLPSIEYMDLWFGDDNYGGNTTAAELEELLTGKNVPKLKHLGLMNSSFVEDMIPALAKSKLLAQLDELSFAHGTLTDEAAEVIVEHADAFRHLKSLDVSNNYLSSDAIASLKKVCPVVSDVQREGEDRRYVALSE